MPLRAIEKADVDHVLHLRDVAPALVRLTAEPTAAAASTPVPPDMRTEADIAAMKPEALAALDRPGASVPISCPDCDGTLFELQEGTLPRYRCRVGHAFSMDTLLALQSNVIEIALWNAMVALKEKAAVIRKVLAFILPSLLARRNGDQTVRVRSAACATGEEAYTLVSMVVVDREMRVQAWNQRSEEIWGLRGDEVEGKQIMSLDIGLPVDRLIEPIRDCLADESDSQEVTLAATNRRGRAIDYKVTCSPLRGSGRENRGVILLMEEVKPER